MIYSFPSDSFSNYIRELRAQQKKIVFTNGCFDLLHWGHVSYLQQAKSKGDILMVGLNSDESVRRLKGPTRPIQDVKSRSQVLQELKSVDDVVIFEEDTPLSLIQSILPDFLIKGADYAIDKIEGAEDVMKNGGIVQTIDLEEGYSTSKIEERIKSAL
jgi:rfaE bifunctional protein nucleotidyltransferase chain/domain